MGNDFAGAIATSHAFLTLSVSVSSGEGPFLMACDCFELPDFWEEKVSRRGDRERERESLPLRSCSLAGREYRMVWLL
jgi:hypothetical protein